MANFSDSDLEGFIKYAQSLPNAKDFCPHAVILNEDLDFRGKYEKGDIICAYADGPYNNNIHPRCFLGAQNYLGQFFKADENGHPTTRCESTFIKFKISAWKIK